MTVVCCLFSVFVGVADFRLIKNNLILGGDSVQCLRLLLKTDTVALMGSVLNCILNINNRKVDKHFKH